MPYIAYLPNSRVTLLDLDEVAEVLNVSQKPHTDTARVENSRPTASAGRSWFPKKRCLPSCMAQNHRNPRLAPANMLPVDRSWNRPNLQSFRQTI